MNLFRTLVSDFKSQVALEGPSRTILLQKIVSGAAAYAQSVPVGSILEADAFYNKLASTNVLSIVSDINELHFINTESTIVAARKLWKARYNTVNTYYPDLYPQEFFKEMSELERHLYVKWVPLFIKRIRGE